MGATIQNSLATSQPHQLSVRDKGSEWRNVYLARKQRMFAKVPRGKHAYAPSPHSPHYQLRNLFQQRSNTGSSTSKGPKQDVAALHSSLPGIRLIPHNSSMYDTGSDICACSCSVPEGQSPGFILVRQELGIVRPIVVVSCWTKEQSRHRDRARRCGYLT